MPSLSECPCRKKGGEATSNEGESCQMVRGDKKKSEDTVDSNGESCQLVEKEKSA